MNLHKDYCEKLNKVFFEAGVRFEDDYRDEKLGFKIREAQTKKIPYQLVIGDNEVNTNTVTYRCYGKQEQINVPVDEFVAMVKEQIKDLK